MNAIFNGLFDSESVTVISITDFLLCISVSLALGFIIAFTYTFKTKHTSSFVITLALLPTVVCVVIMMVNGSIGAGVAVAGAFSLIRFRSAPGNAKEIVMIFLAMGIGLIVGMGYLGFAVLFTAIMCTVFVVYVRLGFGARKNDAVYKTLKITIPEDLDYTGVFDDIFEEYTNECELISVKTHNMGSLFRLTYNITLSDATREKELIDKLRIRNGNLEIMVSRQENTQHEL